MMLVTIILSEIVVTMFLLTLIFRYASFLLSEEPITEGLITENNMHTSLNLILAPASISHVYR